MVGVIGLSGTLVGAGVAFAGVVYQQGRQAGLLRAERREALAHQAVDTMMAELEKVRALAWSVPHGQEDPPDFGEALGRSMDVVQLAALRLPDRELREAIEAACVLGFGDEESFRAQVDLQVRRIVMGAMVWDVQKCLGAYLRQEARPDTTFLFQARDYYYSMIQARRP
ncbi:hypothetical protein [Streptomyces sp. NPDC059010]|uniref:hypothetical protein n=1 Tax=Streptomyces sp. NPDC059010 TaxID=3346695 RepID=UPI0036C45861